MKVLVLGATGYVGAAVADHLADAGHEVVELSRTARPERPRQQRIADLADPRALTAAVTADIDAVVHAATPTGDAGTDAAAVDALTAPLRGTGRPFLYTSGIWVLGPTGSDPVDETTPTNPIPIVGYRPAIERQALAAHEHGVRSIVIRPGIVHGRGGGIPALLVDLARQHGAPRYVGDKQVRWPAVHVDDLADLFVLALERAPGGSIWHGVAEPAVSVVDLAAAAGSAAGLTASPQAWPVEQASAALGAPFAAALALSQHISGDLARDKLAWKPDRVDAVTDLRAGSYR
ncbi:NAD-dependent epimerase/dehydratase family protein [Phytohabitans aurantiacus]|uniref:NAD-dependent epimerase/dehydratase domain-containing protein n=1 Tax=Phytohabitans aurantiacus TaxID=3016789 RepID=A0ABQ5QNR4_9ACTN|nr:NAD-dependent epimerase/dehydratase family protein [Phytohabitans aurantiacus]GLH96311.1 hypothetical protein Pa4123_15850 [Phytohabitans aurantiacus]